MVMQKKEALWRIGKLRRDRPACLNASIQMAQPEPSASAAGGAAGSGGRDRAGMALRTSEAPTFEVSFQITGSALSGLQVQSLEVGNVKYKPYKGVKYVTRSGFFQIRS